MNGMKRTPELGVFFTQDFSHIILYIYIFSFFAFTDTRKMGTKIRAQSRGEGQEFVHVHSLADVQ